jgi:hypothetical protein
MEVAMAMCDQCEALAGKGLEMPPHENLRQMDTTEIKVVAGPTIYETWYVCAACDTKWRRLEDFGDKIGGWFESE